MLPVEHQVILPYAVSMRPCIIAASLSQVTPISIYGVGADSWS
jgi:hypothetical protein